MKRLCSDFASSSQQSPMLENVVVVGASPSLKLKHKFYANACSTQPCCRQFNTLSTQTAVLDKFCIQFNCNMPVT